MKKDVIASKSDETKICVHCARSGIFRLQRNCPYQVKMVEIFPTEATHDRAALAATPQGESK